jgi:hypothetical protein
VPQPDFVTAAAAAAGAVVGGSRPTALMRAQLRWGCRHVLRHLDYAPRGNHHAPPKSRRARPQTCGCRHEGRPQ